MLRAVAIDGARKGEPVNHQTKPIVRLRGNIPKSCRTSSPEDSAGNSWHEVMNSVTREKDTGGSFNFSKDTTLSPPPTPFYFCLRI